jgi:hypothetical protein
VSFTHCAKKSPKPNAPEIEPDFFRKACGPEGLVSKQSDRSYRAGTSPNWLKVKKPEAPRHATGQGCVRCQGPA